MTPLYLVNFIYYYFQIMSYIHSPEGEVLEVVFDTRREKVYPCIIMFKNQPKAVLLQMILKYNVCVNSITLKILLPNDVLLLHLCDVF